MVSQFVILNIPKKANYSAESTHAIAVRDVITVQVLQLFSIPLMGKSCSNIFWNVEISQIYLYLRPFKTVINNKEDFQPPVITRSLTGRNAFHHATLINYVTVGLLF